MLVNGRWTDDWQPVQQADAQGRFIRQTSGFRSRIGGDNGRDFPAVAGRYRLYAAYICPWASRVLIARRLKRLESVIDVVMVDPRLSPQGWALTGAFGTDLDPSLQAQYLHSLYSHADPEYTGRATVPVLWDTSAETIVNNESADLLRILDEDFDALTPGTPRLHPPHLAAAMTETEQWLYRDFNNGVYQAGFASTQQAYEEAVERVFSALDRQEQRLSRHDWLVGSQLTGTDIRAFVTLVRFELAYRDLFRCNLRPLSDYPGLYRYVDRLLSIPAFAASVPPDQIKAGYYSIKRLNPTGIVPMGPQLTSTALGGLDRPVQA